MKGCCDCLSTHLSRFVPGTQSSLAQLLVLDSRQCSFVPRPGSGGVLPISYLSRRRLPSRDPYPEQGRGPVPVTSALSIHFLDRSAHLVPFNSCLFMALNSTVHFSLLIAAFGTPASTDTKQQDTRSFP